MTDQPTPQTPMAELQTMSMMSVSIKSSRRTNDVNQVAHRKGPFVEAQPDPQKSLASFLLGRQALPAAPSPYAPCERESRSGEHPAHAHLQHQSHRLWGCLTRLSRGVCQTPPCFWATLRAFAGSGCCLQSAAGSSLACEQPQLLARAALTSKSFPVAGVSTIALEEACGPTPQTWPARHQEAPALLPCHHLGPWWLSTLSQWKRVPAPHPKTADVWQLASQQSHRTGRRGILMGTQLPSGNEGSYLVGRRASCSDSIMVVDDGQYHRQTVKDN